MNCIRMYLTKADTRVMRNSGPCDQVPGQATYKTDVGKAGRARACMRVRGCVCVGEQRWPQTSAPPSGCSQPCHHLQHHLQGQPTLPNTNYCRGCCTNKNTLAPHCTHHRNSGGRHEGSRRRLPRRRMATCQGHHASFFRCSAVPLLCPVHQYR